MIIRDLKYEEIEKLGALMKKSGLLTLSDTSPENLEYRVQLEIISLQQRYKEVLAMPKPTILFRCIEDNSEIIGFSILYLGLKEEISGTPQLCVYDWSVIDGFSGKKAAVLIIEDFKIQAKKYGYQYCFGILGLQNHALQKLYAKKGFRFEFLYGRKEVN